MRRIEHFVCVFLCRRCCDSNVGYHECFTFLVRSDGVIEREREEVGRQYHEWHAWPDYIEHRPVSGGDGLAPDPDPTAGVADDLIFGTTAFLF